MNYVLRNKNLVKYICKNESSLNIASTPYIPQVKKQSTIDVSTKKDQLNLNCSGTIVLDKLDLDSGSYTPQKFSKSGRIPNELKYKTELCKNFLVGK